MRDKIPCVHKQMVLAHINKLTGELNIVRFRWVIPLDDAVDDACWSNISVFGSSLLSYSVLHRLLSLRPVLPLGYPDWQIYRCNPLWFSFVEAKCDWNKPLTVAQPHFVFSHNPWILLTSGKTCASIDIWRAVSASLLSPPTHTCARARTHTYFISLFPQQSGEGCTGKKEMAACFCLALSPLGAAAARELAWAGAWAGHKATGTTVSPIWCLFHYSLWFCLPIICLPRQQIESGHSCPGIFWQLILFALPKA